MSPRKLISTEPGISSLDFPQALKQLSHFTKHTQGPRTWREIQSENDLISNPAVQSHFITHMNVQNLNI